MPDDARTPPVAFDDALQALRTVAHIRRCAARLAAFRHSAKVKPKLDEAERRALGDLLMAVDSLVPGCPPDAVLYRQLDEPPDALDTRLQQLQRTLVL